MNKQNFQKLRDAIAEAPEEDFSMEFHVCGTAMCLAGWGAILARAEINESDCFYLNGKRVEPDNVAQDFLGLDRSSAHDIFYPPGPWSDYATVANDYDATKADALRYLDSCIRTGSIYNRDHGESV